MAVLCRAAALGAGAGIHTAERRAPCRIACLQVPDASLSLRVDITQPLMSQTGQLRWALNNVVR